MLTPEPDLSPEGLSASFEATEPFSVGVEEEVMLLDPQSLDLFPCAPEALKRLEGDERFKAELPAAQLEIMTAPQPTAAGALAELAEGRRDLADALEGLALAATAGVHPFAAIEGELSEGDRYEPTRERYGAVAKMQLVAALQVHVAVGGADRTLAVYNALRPRLPEIAALAANAAIYAGRDTGMASVRPKIAELLPRQGLPPAIESWDQLSAELRWGAASGSVPVPRLWWWELRPHPGFGTLELRVPDAQTTLSDAAAIIGTAQALVAHLAERHDAGEAPDLVPDWRIAENRWSAARDGVEGEMADLESGETIATRDRLGGLLDELGPIFARLKSEAMAQQARALVSENGAMRQRAVFQRDGAKGVARALAERFGEPAP